MEIRSRQLCSHENGWLRHELCGIDTENPQDCACLIVIVTALTFRGSSNMKDSANDISPRTRLPTLNFFKICAIADWQDFDLSRRICPTLLDAECNEGPWERMNSSRTNMPGGGGESQKHMAQLDKARSLCNPRARRLLSQRRAVSHSVAASGAHRDTNQFKNPGSSLMSIMHCRYPEESESTCCAAVAGKIAH